MILAKFFVDNKQNFLGFDVKGHSNSAPSGEDIICAAVSSATFLTVNTLTDVLYVNADVDVFDDGRITLKISKNDLKASRSLLRGFYLHMKALEQQYKDNINVVYVEV